MQLDELRQKFLSHDGHALIIGGPGSGKTTIALKKAIRRINHGLLPGQSVVFLSFSRSAVARIMEASKLHLSKDEYKLLEMQTFHSFFWNLLASHGYLLGVHKPLQILLPQDEKVLSGGIKKKNQKSDNTQWLAWLNERKRLFYEEGRIAFDLFAENALALIQRSSYLQRMLVQRYPLIILDEAQDTNEYSWRFIAALAEHTQIVCLADLEQQIFDHLEGVGPERIKAIKASLSPLEIDLGYQNYRSPNSEIAIFGQNILAEKTKSSSYKGISRLTYNPKPPHFNLSKIIRIALSSLYRHIHRETGKWSRSIAILAPTGAAAAKISAALSLENKPVRHKFFSDETEIFLSVRFIAFLIEPKYEQEKNINLVIALELLSDIKLATGSAQKSKNFLLWANKIRNSNKVPASGLLQMLSLIIDHLQKQPFCGEPAKDLALLKKVLRDYMHDELMPIIKYIDYLVAFTYGKRIKANLIEIWQSNGNYTKAREVFDLALAQDQIFAGLEDDQACLEVMTIHKSKGKQFDGVIIFREGVRDKQTWRSNFIWQDDYPPYPRSRKILRVAITRARVHTLILDPTYPYCPLLGPHFK